MSPSSVNSPLSLAPAPHSTRQEPSDDGPASQPASLITSKKWVVPPRPKPGRKPATDAPPTKRKAQNRAAQRAFRERRAAKVGQLEGSIKEIGKEYERGCEALQLQIARLEADLGAYRSQLLAWQQRCDVLARDRDTERRGREEVERELQTLRRAREVHGQDLPPAEALQPSQEAGSEMMDCGNCTSTGRCECFEQSIRLGSLPTDVAEMIDADQKRPHSPEMDGEGSKRLQTARGSPKLDPDALETDFTAIYSTKAPVPTKASMESTDRVNAFTMADRVDERCGFCEDGTTCVCALDDDHVENFNGVDGSTRALSRFTPPPSINDVQPGHRMADTSRSSGSVACSSRPGTCAQCRADPNSTVFCKVLAAMKSVSNADECCASSSAPPCETPSLTARVPPPQLEPPTLSCADTFAELSRHPRYAEASDSFGSWLGHLKTSTTTLTSAKSPAQPGLVAPDAPGMPAMTQQDQHSRKQIASRTAMEVEAASVMGVLKLFDRRFGRGEK